MKTSTLMLICVTGLLFFIYSVFGQSAESQPILWCQDANSIVLSKDRLTKLGDAFPSWKVKQVTWPSEKEVDSNSVTVSEGLKQSCIGWLKKFIKEDQLPANLQEHLIAMEGWGLIREQTEQKRLCDVFITRFKKGNHVIHIQESPYNVVIAVSDKRFIEDNSVNHGDLIMEIAKSILNENFEPSQNPKDMHVTEISRNGHKITKASWIAKAALKIDEKGRICSNTAVSQKIGASVIRCETDGRFVRFEIVKSPGAVKNAYFDPYIRRFNPPPPQDSPAKKQKNPEAEGEMFKQRSEK